MVISRAEVHAWAAAEMARRSVADLAEAASSLDVTLVAIKGVHLAWCVSKDPAYRPMADADVVVARGSFDKLVRHVLGAPGFDMVFNNWSTNGLSTARGGLVDVHRMLLPPLWGRFRRASLLTRAVAAPALHPRVLVPDLLDAAALAVAHFVKDGFGAIEPTSAALDLALLADTGVGPSALATRLAEHGLRRIGLVGFTELTRRDARFEPYRDAAARSRLERSWADAMVNAVPLLAARRPYAAFMLIRAIGDDLSGACGSLTMAAARGVRDQVRALVRD
jgi:hypothetical protein